MILTWLLWYLWGTVGVQLFAGSFYTCSNTTFTYQSNCTDAGHQWVNSPYHFDNIGAAMTTVYVLNTFSGWTSIACTGVDSVGPGVAPQLNSPYHFDNIG